MAKQESAEVKKAEFKFEKALKRLEEIVASMESGDLELDDLVSAFEEGQKLVQQCSAKLNEVEQRIEVLTRGAAGEVKKEPLEEVPF